MVNSFPAAAPSLPQQTTLAPTITLTVDPLPTTHATTGPASRTRLAAQELSISVPTIVGYMDSWQFEILLDVINNTFAAPLPQVCMRVPACAGA